MNKTELKAAWGKYCDTDVLVDQMVEYMASHRIRHSVNGICTMLNTFFENKHEIIEMLQNSDNYIGNLRVKVNAEMTRYNNIRTIETFVRRFYNNVDAEKIIYKKVNSEGKTLNDYIKIGKKKVTVDELVNGDVASVDFGNWYTKFDCSGVTAESLEEARNFQNIISCFNRYSSPVVNNVLSESILARNNKLKISQGTKTSRAFNKVCHLYGVDSAGSGVPVKIASGAKFIDGTDVPNGFINVTLNAKNVNGDSVEIAGINKAVNKKYVSNVKYNKLFAEYSDMLSDTKRKIKFYISVNPIDYLTMSVGRSWQSCHQYGGGYFGGTVSYMLDSVSIITFVHDEEPDDFMTEGKIYRNMMHYKNGTLLQSRVYPQGNDGCTDLYEEFRKIMQKEISDMLGINGEWEKVNKDRFTINSEGVHYKDYHYFGNGINLSRIHGTNCSDMLIGHINICPNCGNEDHLSSHTIAHGNCSAI